MDRRLALLGCVALAGCTQPEGASVQVLVGGTLEGAAIDHPVIVVEKGRIAAVGPQTRQPIPRGSAKTDTRGYRIRHASGGAVEPGRPADLDLISPDGEVVRRMRAGVWQ
jgi:hypothetical protein